MCALEVRSDRDHRIEIAGDIRIHNAPTLWRQLLRRTQNCVSSDGRLEIDLANVTSIDGIGAALLLEIRDATRTRGVDCVLANASPQAGAMLQLYRTDTSIAARKSAAPRRGFIVRIGAGVEAAWLHFHGPIVFLGELGQGFVAALRWPRRVHWRSVPSLMVRGGADALVIVLVLNFLIGVVMALQAAPSLTAFGANVYVADLVGVSVTRELVPLMTAIIIAGRSGASIAAELGTMHVSEEIDALQTMGISPIPYLVLPRMIAVTLIAPMLSLMGDVAAIAGGGLVAVVSLGMSWQGYLAELRTILLASDVWTGLLKAAVFAIAVAVIACQEGLAARGAAAGVGRRTTATVVVSLFMIVLLDTVLTVAFRELGV